MNIQNNWKHRVSSEKFLLKYEEIFLTGKESTILNEFIAVLYDIKPCMRFWLEFKNYKYYNKLVKKFNLYIDFSNFNISRNKNKFECSISTTPKKKLVAVFAYISKNKN
ncbi:hypothetical protein GF327_04250 [Candidatus Woesearchaeota archaeon]|nr:hypothetical protein [Candidatus Woesearchaeota archaeon]